MVSLATQLKNKWNDAAGHQGEKPNEFQQPTTQLTAAK